MSGCGVGWGVAAVLVGVVAVVVRECGVLSELECVCACGSVGEVVVGVLLVSSTCTSVESGIRVCLSCVHPQVGGVVKGLDCAGA